MCVGALGKKTKFQQKDVSQLVLCVTRKENFDNTEGGKNHTIQLRCLFSKIIQLATTMKVFCMTCQLKRLAKGYKVYTCVEVVWC